MKKGRKILSLLTVFCMLLMLLPITTIAGGIEELYYVQPLGIVEGTNSNIEYELSYYRMVGSAEDKNYYEASLHIEETNETATIKAEDLTTLIILDKITDKYGTFPVKVADYTFSNTNMPLGALSNVTTVYIPADLLSAITATNSFLEYCEALTDVYYGGDENRWKEEKAYYIQNPRNKIHHFINNQMIEKEHPIVNATVHFSAYPELEVTYGKETRPNHYATGTIIAKVKNKTSEVTTQK